MIMPSKLSKIYLQRICFELLPLSFITRFIYQAIIVHFLVPYSFTSLLITQSYQILQNLLIGSKVVSVSFMMSQDKQQLEQNQTKSQILKFIQSFSHLNKIYMSFYNNLGLTDKTAANSTNQTYMRSVNTYVKNSPAPSTVYQPDRNLIQKTQTNRKIGRRNVSGVIENPVDQPKNQKIIQTPGKAQVEDRRYQRNKIQSNPVAMTDKKEEPPIVTPKQPRRSVKNFSIKQFEKDKNTPTSGNQAANKIPDAMLTYNSNVWNPTQTPNSRNGQQTRLRLQKTQQVLPRHKVEPIKLTEQIQDPNNFQTQQSQITTIRVIKQSPKNQKLQFLCQNVSTYKTEKYPMSRATLPANINKSIDKQKPTQNQQYSRASLKTKKIDLQSATNIQKIQQQQNKKPRSHLIIFVLKKLYHQSISIFFSQLTRSLQISRQRQTKYAKLFFNRLSLVQAHSNLQNCRNCFNKIYKHTGAQKKTLKNQHKQTKDSIQFKVKNHLPLVLARLEKAKLWQANNKLKSQNKRKKTLTEMKLCNVINKLFSNKKRYYFTKFIHQTNQFHSVKVRQLANMSSILRLYKIRMQEKFYKKIKSMYYKLSDASGLDRNKKEQQAKRLSPKKVIKANRSQSSLMSGISPKSDKNNSEAVSNSIIAKLEQKYKQNSKIMQQLVKQTKSSSEQFDTQKQNLKKVNSQLMQVYEQKIKIQQQLKQKAQSLQFPQQDYIQGSELLIDTRFPTLYDVYIKLQKSAIDQININDLYALYPSIEEEISKDNQVKQWLMLSRNLWLKNQINKYQGTNQIQRKAAKLAEEEQLSILQLIKGYVKQRYTWQWVRNALSNVSNVP